MIGARDKWPGWRRRSTGHRGPAGLPKNLTPHPSAAISKWTEQDFIATLRTARRPDGTEPSPVMPRVIGQMSDDELKAIWMFLARSNRCRPGHPERIRNPGTQEEASPGNSEARKP